MASPVSGTLAFKIVMELTLFWTARRGSDFYFILVLQVLAKKVGQIGVVIRKFFDFVEASSQFSIQISANSGEGENDEK